MQNIEDSLQDKNETDKSSSFLDDKKDAKSIINSAKENVDNGFFTNDDEDAEKEIKTIETTDKSSNASEKIIPIAPDAAQSINNSSAEDEDTKR